MQECRALARARLRTHLPVTPVLLRHFAALGVQEGQKLRLYEPDVIVISGRGRTEASCHLAAALLFRRGQDGSAELTPHLTPPFASDGRNKASCSYTLPNVLRKTKHVLGRSAALSKIEQPVSRDHAKVEILRLQNQVFPRVFAVAD